MTIELNRKNCSAWCEQPRAASPSNQRQLHTFSEERGETVTLPNKRCQGIHSLSPFNSNGLGARRPRRRHREARSEVAPRFSSALQGDQASDAQNRNQQQKNPAGEGRDAGGCGLEDQLAANGPSRTGSVVDIEIVARRIRVNRGNDSSVPGGASHQCVA